MTDNKAKQEESLIEYPCEFPIKVMGLDDPDFYVCVNKIAEKHDPEFSPDETKEKKSSNGKYTSLTLNIHAKDKAQLDNIYQDLTDHDLVKWVL